MPKVPGQNGGGAAGAFIDVVRRDLLSVPASLPRHHPVDAAEYKSRDHHIDQHFANSEAAGDMPARSRGIDIESVHDPGIAFDRYTTMTSVVDEKRFE